MARCTDTGWVLGGHWTWWWKETCSHVLRIEPWLSGRPARSLIAVLTKLRHVNMWIRPQNTTARYFPDTCRVVSHPVEEGGVWATLYTCDHEAVGSSCNCYFILCVLFSYVSLLCSWGSGVLSLRWSKGWSYTSVSPACFHCVHRGNFTLFYIFIIVVPFLPLYLACFFSFPFFRPPAWRSLSRWKGISWRFERT